MSLLRPTLLALSLAAALVPRPAAADVAPPALPIGIPDPSNLWGLELNQWYVGANGAVAGSVIDGRLSQEGSWRYLPSAAEMTRTAQDSQASGSKQGSAFAQLSPTRLGASAMARDPLDPASTGTLAVGYSVVSYWAVLEQNTSFQFQLKLDGQLRTLGERATGADRSGSGAAVAALAVGSPADLTNEKQYALFDAAGLGAVAEGGDALLRQLGTLQSSNQPHLDAFGAQTDTVTGALDVDTTLLVTAEGTQLHCDTPVSPACGRYFYMMTVMLFTGAQDGGTSDFSNTLSVDSFSVGGGAAQPFAPLSPVPEPASAAMLALGLATLAGLARRRAVRVTGPRAAT